MNTKLELRLMRSGFTLIELLIVIVVIGIIASIAIPKYHQVRERSYFATLRSDVATFVTHQELYYQVHSEYADLDQLTDYHSSRGVEIDLGWLERNGFAIVATHIAMPDRSCGYFMGAAPPESAGPAVQAGQIACE